MPHDNSVFHSMLKLVSWDDFDDAVARHAGQVHPRGFTDKSHLVAMLYAQFAGASSLREIEAGLRSHASRLYHLGVRPPRRSSLADANRDRPAAVFSELLAAMVQRAHRGLRRAMDGTVYLIDSTSLMLTARSADWARFSEQVCGVMTGESADAITWTRTLPDSRGPSPAMTMRREPMWRSPWNLPLERMDCKACPFSEELDRAAVRWGEAYRRGVTARCRPCARTCA